ncbi:hypothetical protein LguiA_001592 [Lonicera macranthoides]
MFLGLRLPIIALFYFYFLHNLVSTFATTSFNKLAVDNRNSFDNNQAIFASKPGKLFLASGRVKGTVNVVIIVLGILNIVVYKLRQLCESNSGEKLGNAPEQLCRRFSVAEILSATNNFEESLIIGKGGFGITYKGVIDNGTRRVAIKRLKPMSKQGAPEFRTEIAMLTKVRHCHVISLIGYCDSENEMMIVYEYMDHGSFADHINKCGGNGDDNHFSWVRSLEICIEAARAIDYLHTGSFDGIQHIIHCDVKSSNILLDDNWTAKISDFGFSTIGPTNTSSIKGTLGYRDPARKLTYKSDVYAFGVVLFEVLSGRPAIMDIDFYMDQWLLARWAQRCIKEGKVDEIINPNLRGKISQDCLSVFVQTANQCIDDEPEKRPTMAEVVIRLENALAVQHNATFTADGAYESPERVGSPIVEGEIFDSGGNFDRQDYEDSSVVEGNIFNSGGSCHTKIEVSSTFDEFFNAGGTYENQTLEGSSIFEEISNAGRTRENQELEGSSVVEDEISNADNGMRQDENIAGNIQLVEENGTESPTKAKRMKFTVKARSFIFGSRER